MLDKQCIICEIFILLLLEVTVRERKDITGCNLFRIICQSTEF